MAGSLLSPRGGETQHVHCAGGSHYRFTGAAAFTTSATTMAITVRDIKLIKRWGFGANSDERIYVSDTLNADGTLTVPASGVVNVDRAAGGTSAAKFTFWFEG